MIYFILGLGQTSNFSWDESNPGGGGGILPHMGYKVCAAGKGMVFKLFPLG